MYPVVELSGSARGGGGGSGIPVYPKKFAKIPQNTQNSSKYTQNKFKENDRYTEYLYFCNIPYTRFKKPLNTVYPKTLADPKLLVSLINSYFAFCFFHISF